MHLTTHQIKSLLRTHRRLILVIAILVLPTGSALAYHAATNKQTTTPTAAPTRDVTNNQPTISAPSAGSATAAKPNSSTAPESKTTALKPSTTKTATPQASPKPSTPSPTPTKTPGNCPNGQVGTPPNCITAHPLPLGMAGTWNMIFQDDFNTLNTATWATQRGEAAWSYGNPYNPQYEDAFYVPNNPKTTGGNLILTLNQGASNGYPYSSGMIQNGRSFSYKYGYVEARVKVPSNVGVWPAFWTLPAPIDQYWPPEIDIFEFGLGGYSHTRPTFNYHYGTYPNNQQMHGQTYGNSGVDYTQDFHVYGMLWTSSKIQVFIDGQPGPSYTNAATITDLPQYLIFNLALQKGATVPSGTSMYVDYVRVWQ